MISRLQRALRETTSFTAPSVLATGIISGALLFQPGQAQAQQVWNGTGSDFNTGANWTPSTVPGVGNVAVFDGTTLNNNLSISANTSLGAITYNAGASPYAITLGDNLQLFGNVTNNSGVAQTINVGDKAIYFLSSANSGSNLNYNVTSGGEVQFRDSSVGGLSRFTLGPGSMLAIFDTANAVVLGSLSGSGLIRNFAPSASTLTIGGLNETSTFSGVIAEGGGGGLLGVEKVGTGTFTLSGTNTYTGLTTVSAGTLTVSNATGLGAISGGTTVAAGATLALTGGITVGAEALTLSGTGVAGTGALTSLNSGVNTFQGAITLAAASSITAQNLSLLSLSGGISGANTDLALGGSSNNGGTISGVIAIGSGSITKSGTQWTLAGANTYSGLTTVNSGSLFVTNSLGLGSTASGSVVASGASLALGNGVNIVGEALTLSGTGGGGFGALVASGGTSSYGGNITLAADSQINAGFLTIPGTLTVSGGITGSGQNLTLAGPGTGTASGVIATGTGGLTKIDAGTWTLTGANTYTGATTINGGTLIVNGSLASSSVSVGSGTTLGGAGSIAGAVTVAAGGTLSAGNSPGTLTVGSLALNAGSNTVFELGTPGVAGGATNDRIIVNGIGAAGNLTLGGTLTANVASAGYYRLFDVTGGGTISGSFSSLALTAPSVPGATGTVYSMPAGVPPQVNLAVIGAGQILQFWDGADQAGNGAVNGGMGAWNGGNTNWAVAPGEVGFNAPWLSSAGVFQGTAGTVTVSGTQSFDTLQFNSDGYVLNGGTLRLGVADGGTINTAAGVTVSIGSAMIDGFGTSLTKVGAGTLALSGTNSYSGGTLLNAGTLAVGSASALGTGTLQMASGTTLRANAPALTLANAMALSSGTATIDTGTFDSGLTGVISGAGTLSKTGTGTLTLSGINSYTGATWIQDGTLRMGGVDVLPNQTAVQISAGAVFDLNGMTQTIGSLSGTGNVLLGGTTLTAGGNNSSTTFSGTISGAGSLLKDGTGTLTLNGTNTYTSATQVFGGSLVVDGSVATPVIVHAGATLAGSGSVGATTVGGTLSPGNSPGTLTVNGNLVMGVASTYIAEVQGSVADRVNVTGTASLAGTLRIVPLGGAYTFNSAYTLLSAAGGLGGTSFGPVDTTGSFGDGVTTTVSYTANDVQLTLAPKALAPIVDPVVPTSPRLNVGRPANAHAVASAIDGAVANGADPSALFGIYNLSSAAIPAAVNSLSGEVHTAAPAMAHVASDQFLRTMLDGSGSGRLSGAPGGPAGAAGFSADLPLRQDGPGRPTFDPARFTLWGATFGSTGRNDGDRAVGSANRNLSDAHVAVGADIRLGSSTVVGAAVAGGQARASLSGGLGKAEADVFQAGLHGRTTLGTVNLAAALGYARLETDTTRAIPALGLTGVAASYATQAWSGRIEASLPVASWGGITLSPLAAFQAVRANRPAAIERDGMGATAGMLTLARRSDMTSRSELGLQFDANLIAGAMPVTGFVRAAWAHYYQRDADLTAALNGLPGASFAVSGARPDRNAALLAAGADIRLSQTVSLGARIDSELSGNTRRVGGTAQLRVSF
ncbi:MAG: autotransporter-associated beta strand repeat-containing protein [Kaiparowitsia implicata GSE-PSE-MK54-09C]|jgi:autotransporter-associated beta strand protein|nr:autotransporter-associated beta strand repeat-containing protein [Kaiparowitsia implicata GSE-PSE-MK54-09C]